MASSELSALGVAGEAHYKAKFKVSNPNLKVLSEMKKAGVELYVCGQNLAFAPRECLTPGDGASSAPSRSPFRCARRRTCWTARSGCSRTCAGSRERYLLGAAAASIAALLAVVTHLWTRRCRPGVCQRLRALIAGAGLGTLALALLAVFGLSAPQLLPVLLAGAGIAIVAAIVAWRKGCF